MVGSIRCLLVLCFILTLCACRGIRPPEGAVMVERTMETTGYCRCGECCGWRRTWYGLPVYASGLKQGQRKMVGITASGARAWRGTIAADTKKYPFGTVIYVPGYGYGRVEDRGAAIKGDHIDLYFPSHTEAKAWGNQKKTAQIWFPPRR